MCVRLKDENLPDFVLVVLNEISLVLPYVLVDIYHQQLN